MIDSILDAIRGVFGNDSVEDLMNTEEYKNHGFSIVACPICGRKTLDMFWICSGCGWEYDIFINYDENEESLCNGCTPNEYRRQYLEVCKALITKENI